MAPVAGNPVATSNIVPGSGTGVSMKARVCPFSVPYPTIYPWSLIPHARPISSLPVTRPLLLMSRA